MGLFDALSHSQPQLIMLDIMLPGMDGIEILKALRGNPATARIPVIIASARGTEYDLSLIHIFPRSRLRRRPDGQEDVYRTNCELHA